MKRLLIFTCICILIIAGCKKENNKAIHTHQKQTGKIIKNINYDDELDIKATATVDTVEFRKQLSQILPNSRILELFGAGYQIFYLALDIYDDDKKAYFQLTPEAGSWVSGFERIQRSLLKENIGLSENFAIIPQKNGDSKAYDLTMVFYSFHWAGNSFKTSPGLINGKKVNSRKTYQIDMSIDNSGKVINQWTIKEINREKFRPQLKGNLMSDFFKGYFPAVLKDDYKSLKDKVEFPQESIKRGVSGKVL
ncbi:MAG: hypothetical protein Q8L04_06240, partial [Ignavibacteria bacterium]|nr:hypothetical protein [Ignavibacteria bacterium]